MGVGECVSCRPFKEKIAPSELVGQTDRIRGAREKPRKNTIHPSPWLAGGCPGSSILPPTEIPLDKSKKAAKCASISSHQDGSPQPKERRTKMATRQRAEGIKTSSSSSSLEISSDDSVSSDCNNIASLIDPSRQFEESLKYDETEIEKDEDEENGESSSSAGTDRRTSVQFDMTVSGIEIPLHRDYPESDRKRMWMSFEEIHKNAERNINEFRADNWEWRNACEEDDMMVQSVGVLVHPASYKRPTKICHKRGGKGSKKKKLHRRKSRQYAS